jgi:alkylation response protein AidB-like acyl-CoA dehydrogenase
MGGYGYTASFRAERMMRDARIGRSIVRTEPIEPPVIARRLPVPGR